MDVLWTCNVIIFWWKGAGEHGRKKKKKMKWTDEWGNRWIEVREWKSEKGKSGKQMEPERGWADLIYSQGLRSLLSDHSDRQRGFGRLIKIIISYPSHITLADGTHVLALLSSSCQRCHRICDNSWWSLEGKLDFEAMPQLNSLSFSTLNALLAQSLRNERADFKIFHIWIVDVPGV